MRLPLDRIDIGGALLRVRRTARIVVSLAVALMLAIPLTAGAQERKTLLDMLFGKKTEAPAWSTYPPPPPPVQRNQRPRKPAKPAAATTPAPVIADAPVEKRANARTVLVVGDFLANGLGDGLMEAFANAPGVVITTRQSGSSGLVREDFYNWRQELPGMLDEVKPSAVVVLLGANDRQQIDLPDGTRKFGSDEWFAEYGRRSAALATLVEGRKIPLLWVGLPPFQSPSMSADAVKLNLLLRKAAEQAGGDFIDIWDGFADEAGKFVTTGSDINGKPARLRGTDGIGLSKAGKRKLAFYLEKPIKDLLGGDAAPMTAEGLRLETKDLPGLGTPAPANRDLPANTMPVSITDPALDGGDELLGTRPASRQSALSPRDLLVEHGEIAPAPAGRADNARFTP
ncbi:SGNH/GDSL hydrolase family protein [Allorhizobium borbori]|uniref:SGNH hydrolase-type esterase domain-containing protein n=1 Tax=Allorhizobium borbori TaxID=485907 RepID=A0A7W6P053_9HYPH|nr:DUF459 domain-containing protein [Allorhizobium borbori]MBB4102083.1 hypothetical protein [Allorhizobium borbori]